MHRIALFDAAGTIDAVISQMDVLKFMHAHYAAAPWAQQTIQDAGTLPLDPGKRSCAIYH